jgi:hypothetical protein
MEHTLKCWPEHYAAIDSGAKTCELRLNDRPYQRGDALLLKEWEPVENAYTGRELRVRVTHILSGGPWLAPGYVALSIRLMGEDGRVRVQEDFRLSYDKERARADRAERWARRWKKESCRRRKYERVWGESYARAIKKLVTIESERNKLTQLARALDASIHGDGNGRCWCGAKEADALRAALEKHDG